MLLCEGVDLEKLAMDERKELEQITIKEHILLFMKDGLDKKSAIKEVAKRRNISRREVYKESIDL